VTKNHLGIDIGGTGIKGAIVDTVSGVFLTDKIKYKTPASSDPTAVLSIVLKLINDFDWSQKAIGFGFPAIIKNGVSRSASNVHNDWIDFEIEEFFKEKLDNKHITVVNDADAAGLAELTFGAAKGIKGTVLLLTLGTGIGSALMVNGQLIPNTEFGHLKWKDSIAEKHASNRARKKNELNWQDFGSELTDVLQHIELLFSPDCIIIGGGISKNFEEYDPSPFIKAKVFPAALKNNAGIIGAAYYNHLNI